MARQQEDAEREERISTEVVVDAYDSEERAMGWYCYLEEKIEFPFTAVCSARRATSPLPVGAEVSVDGMAPEEECRREIFVMMPWERHGLAVPLSQLRPVHASDETVEAVEDWLYWTARGYEF